MPNSALGGLKNSLGHSSASGGGHLDNRGGTTEHSVAPDRRVQNGMTRQRQVGLETAQFLVEEPRSFNTTEWQE